MTTAAHQAVTSGLHVALTIIAAVACAAGIAALVLVNPQPDYA